MKTTDKSVETISESLDMKPEIHEMVEYVPRPPVRESGDEINDDFDLARNTLRTVLINGETVMESLMHLAKDSEHPRTYEVLAQLMRNLSDVSKDLMELQKKRAELPNKNDDANQNINVDKAVFVGSLKELLSEVEDASK